MAAAADARAAARRKRRKPRAATLLPDGLLDLADAAAQAALEPAIALGRPNGKGPRHRWRGPMPSGT
jgi:hypothetical protein